MQNLYFIYSLLYSEAIMIKFKWFRAVATGILILYMGMMLLTVILAYSRQSGSTGLDMAKIQQIRFDVSYKDNPE